MADNAVLARNVDNAPVDELSSHSVAFSHYNHFSAQLPIDPATGSIVSGGIKEQADQVFKNIFAVIEGIDRKPEMTVRVTIFLKDIADLDAVNEVYANYYKDYLPTRTVVAVDALPLDGALIMADAVLSHGLGTIPDAPQADDLIILARNADNVYKSATSTQTCAFSHYNNLTMQIGIDKSGSLVSGGVAEEAKQALQNVKDILASIDVCVDDIVKINVFLKDLGDLEAVNEVYKTFFPDTAIARTVKYIPARTPIKVKDLPKGASVAFEAVVSHGDGTPPQLVEDRHGLIVEPNNTDKAPKCCMSTQTVAFSHYNNLGAQFGMTAGSDSIVSGGAAAEAEQALANIKAIVESVDHKLEDVVKVNIYLKDLADMAAVDEVYKKFFPDGTPARRVVGVGEIVKGASVMIDAVVSNAEGTPPFAD